MSTLLNRLRAFLRSPEGKRVVAQVRHRANRPETRRQLSELLRRLRGTRTH